MSRSVKGDLGTYLRVLRIGRSSQKRIKKTKEHSRVFCPVVDFPQKTNDVVP